MSVSVQSAPVSTMEYAISDPPKDALAAKFTAVNGQRPAHSPRAFGFRPEQPREQQHYLSPPRSHLKDDLICATEDSVEHRKIKESKSSPPHMKTSSPDPETHEASQLGKRKRSVDAPTVLSDDSMQSKTKTSESGKRSPTDLSSSRPWLDGQPQKDKTSWHEPAFRQAGPSSPDSRLAESLQMDLRGSDSQTLSTSPDGDDDNSGSPSNYDDGSVDVQDQQMNGSENGVRQPRKRQFANRTKTGCHTCRKRKKKCDEGKPYCGNCMRGGFNCGGYGVRKTLAPSTGPAKVISRVGPNTSQSTSQSIAQSTSQISSHPPLYERMAPPMGTERHPYDQTLQNRTHRQSISWPEAVRTYPPPEHQRSRTVPDEDHFDIHDPFASSLWTKRPQPAFASGQPPMIDHSRFAYPNESMTREEAGRLASAARYGTAIASAPAHGHGSIDSSRSAAPVQMALTQPVPPTAHELSRMRNKDKMLIGKPYQHYIDTTLIDERKACRTALERFNNAARPSAGVGDEERSRQFKAVVQPDYLIRSNNSSEPIGRVGNRVLVESPFTCDYGYNINIGDDVIISAGCVMSDPCKITIGSRTIIGPNVKFYGMTLSIDPKLRAGSQALAIGGTITIEEDCFIGADVIILANRTIRKGSVVGAGTTVSKDVQPSMIVAGNPMKTLRGIGPSGDLDQHKPHIQAENETAMIAMLTDRYREGRIPFGR